MHERLFAVEMTENGASIQDPVLLGILQPTTAPSQLPPVTALPEATDVLQRQALDAFLAEVRAERLEELDRVAAHVEVALTELIQREDDKIGRFAEERDRGVEGAAGLLAAAEAKHAELVDKYQDIVDCQISGHR